MAGSSSIGDARLSPSIARAFNLATRSLQLRSEALHTRVIGKVTAFKLDPRSLGLDLEGRGLQSGVTACM